MAALSLDTAIGASPDLAPAPAIADARRLLQQAVQSTRRLLAELSGSAGGAPQDLFEALRLHVSELALSSNERLNFSSSGAAPRLPGVVLATLFDATRELISNARRHGDSQGVEAHLQAWPGRLSITVSNAVRRHATANVTAPGSGLRLHGERLAAIGASLRWRLGSQSVQARIRYAGVSA